MKTKSQSQIQSKFTQKYGCIWLANHKFVKNISIMSNHKLGFKQNDFITMILTSRQIPLTQVSEFLNAISSLVSLYTGQTTIKSFSIKQLIHFLSAFMIHYFPENADCNDKHLTLLSKKIVEIYHKFNQKSYPNRHTIILFYYVIVEFQAKFADWENETKMIELENLAQTFWTECANVYEQLETVKQQIQLLEDYADKYEEEYREKNPTATSIPPIKYGGQDINLVIQQVKNTYKSHRQQFESGFSNLKTRVLKHAYEIGGDTGVKYFNNFVPIFIDPSFTENIRKLVHKAFWDSLESDLTQEPPNYNRLIIVLKELKTYLIACVPNRIDIHYEINNNIDTNLWQQMLTNNAFDTNSIANLVKYVINKIKDWSAPNQKTDIDSWSLELIKILSETNITTDKLIKTIVMFLKGSFQFLENIILLAQQFKNTKEYSLLRNKVCELYSQK